MLKTGDRVKVHYIGKYMDNKVFDSTIESDPILFTIGDEMMIPAFEEAVVSMKTGEKKSITIKAADAYGEYDKELVVKVNRKDVFGDKELKVGDVIQAPSDDGAVVLKVIDIEEDIVVLDGNLEMAGKDVIFDIELVAVLDVVSDSVDDYNIDDELGDELDIDDSFNIEEY